MKFETILLVIEVGGTLAFALSGLLEAIRMRLRLDPEYAGAPAGWTARAGRLRVTITASAKAGVGKKNRANQRISAPAWWPTASGRRR
mgnify:CR=1 FL=1